MSCGAGAGGARRAAAAPSPSPTCHTRSPAAQLAGRRTLPAPQPIALGGRARTLIDAGRSAHGARGRSPVAPRPAAAILSLVSVGRLPAVSGAGPGSGCGALRWPPCEVSVHINVERPSATGRPGRGCSVSACRPPRVSPRAAAPGSCCFT